MRKNWKILPMISSMKKDLKMKRPKKKFQKSTPEQARRSPL